MLSVISLVLLCQSPGQPWHYEKRCDGRQCVFVKVYDPMPATPASKVAPSRLPELLTVPPAPVVSPLPIDRQYFFGVDESKKCNRDRYTVGSVEVTRSELDGTMIGDSPGILPNDSGKPHLTLFAKDEPTRKQLETIVASADAAELRDAYRVQVYDVSASVDREMIGGWSLDRDKRFVDSGRVAVLQSPSETGEGKVYGALFAFQTAKDLVESVPKFDPNVKLPDKGKGGDAADGRLTLNPWQVIATLAVLVFLTLVAQGVLSNRSGGRLS